MSNLIAIDAGHGPDTAGKRTPILPNGQKVPETGRNYMNEFVFNHAVANYLQAELERCGFKTVRTYKSTEDTSLKNRVTTAKNKGADALISIHANANLSVWGTWTGIETFYKPGNDYSKKLATKVHTRIMQGNPITRDRGLKTDNLYITNSSTPTMPAILLELGFMDSKTDYVYLLQESYRKFCAQQVTKGICDYFGVPYKAEVTSSATASKNTSTTKEEPRMVSPSTKSLLEQTISTLKALEDKSKFGDKALSSVHREKLEKGELKLDDAVCLALIVLGRNL